MYYMITKYSRNGIQLFMNWLFLILSVWCKDSQTLCQSNHFDLKYLLDLKLTFQSFQHICKFVMSINGHIFDLSLCLNQ